MNSKNILKSIYLRTLSVLFALLLLLPSVSVADNDGWQAAAGGKSSFLELGEGFYEKVKVREVEGARVVLWNFVLAERLGLTAKDHQALEKLILKNFAVTTIGADGSAREMFSTRYQDYPADMVADLGNPQGDGRAVWSGEMQIPLENGRILYLDFSIKGVGRTPLARQPITSESGATNQQYSDGLQAMSEAIRSFITSVALNKNGVQAVQDLAVIELPFTKVDPGTGREVKAAITVRVGEQTRIGHLAYHLEQRRNEARFRKIFEYVVKRGLGLKLETTVTMSHATQYFRMVTRNIASQAASYLDLNFVHGSLTRGNQTTAGRPIDFGTANIFSGFHARLTYLYDQLLVGNQHVDIFSYLHDFLYFVKNWKQSSSLENPADLVEIEQLVTTESARYWRTYWRDFVIFELQRLGLSKPEVRKLSYGAIKEFMDASIALLNARAATPREVYGQVITPGLFDLHAILKYSMAILEGPQAVQEKAWRRVFVTERGWGTLSANDLRSGAELDQDLGAKLRKALSLKKGEEFVPTPDPEYYTLMQRYIKAVTVIHQQLKGKAVPMALIVERAKNFAKTSRTDRNFPEYAHILQRMSEPGYNFVDISKLTMKVVDSIHDRHEDLSNRDMHRAPIVRCEAVISGSH